MDKFIFFDTESKIKINDKTQDHTLRLGAAHYYDFKKDSEVMQKLRFKNVKDITHFIVTHTRSKNTLHVAAHNLSFDFGLLGLHTELKRRKWVLEFPLLQVGAMILKYRKGDKLLVFLDTLNYFKMSLDDLGKSIGMYKGQVDFHNVTDAKLFEYCDNDVAIIAYMMRGYRQFIIDEEIGKMSFTTPSQAFTAYRSRFMKHPIYIHTHEKTTNLERESYHGGRTEAYFIGTMKRKIYVLDVNSLYPYVMRVNDYPTKLVKYISIGTTKAQLKKYMKNHLIIAHCEIETDKPIYPCKMDKRLVFPVGKFKTVLTTPSIMIALEHGHIKKIYDVSVYEKAPLFSEYVDHFYNLRNTYKVAKNQVYEQMTKLLLNSLYGKFGQRQQKLTAVNIDLDIKNGIIDVFDNAKGKIGVYIVIEGDTFFMEQTKKESANSFPAIASHVTDYARCYLWSLMGCAGRENVFYCDTDSIFCNAKGFANLKEYINPHHLGMLKHESTARTITINGCKDYKLDDLVKIKGISKRAEKLSNSKYRQLHFPSLKTQLKAGGKAGIKVNIVEKNLSRIYYKGVVNPDGRVSPFEY